MIHLFVTISDIYFRLIGVKEELRSGDKVWVIRTSDNEDQLSITDMSIKLLGNSYFPHFESIELIDATVIAIHRDNGFGEDAYYTLSLADSNNNQREIQAETYK